jgi:L-ascorbate metabolism protein UlaG (beta-lactamase superfamily)
MKMVLARACSILAMAWMTLPSAWAAAASIAARAQVFATSAGTVRITPLYHGSARIEAGREVIYIDPAKPFDFSKAPKADLILITDIDEYHMDPEAEAALSKPGTEIVSPAAAARTLAEAWPINNGENKTWHGWTIEAVPNYTLESNHPRAKYAQEKGLHEKGRANGYVLTYGDKRFYFSGASDDVPEIRALKNIDVAFVRVRIGPYPDPAGAAEAALIFLPKIVIPYQYFDSDLAQFRKKLDGTGVEVRVLEGYSQ